MTGAAQLRTAWLECAREDERLLTLACGRLFRLLSRPQQPGDVEAYYAARAVALDAAERLGLNRARYEPNYARERNSGAAGD